MNPIRLIATDLDGTLIGSAAELPMYAAFRGLMNEFRRRNNAVWAICTGRSLLSFKSFFSPMGMMSIRPDFVVVEHAYIYGWSQIGYVPHILWNLHTWYLLSRTRTDANALLHDLHEMIRHFAAGVTTVQKRRNRLWLRFDSDASADTVTEMLKDKLKTYRYIQVIRYPREVDILVVPFTKGLALAELGHHIGIPPEETLAIGNGHNDISMFAPSAARHVGCPSNSEPEVLQEVHKQGGHIAREPALAGTMEVMRAYLDGKVDSSLPEWWGTRLLAGAVPLSSKTRDSQRKRRKKRWAAFLMFGAVSYVVLLVFASFGVLPYVSGLIFAPFRWFIKFVGGIVRFFF